jgi:hypothetical protein
MAFQAKLKRELLQEDNQKSPSRKRYNKSKGRLCKHPNKRAKFLQNPNNRKDPKEGREKTEAWFPKK